MGKKISESQLEAIRELNRQRSNALVRREEESYRRTLSAGERVVETKRLLRNHGVRCINTPTVDGPLGGARGIYLQASGNGMQVTAYHPSTPERRKLLRAARDVLQNAGWRITYWTVPSAWREGRREPFLEAWPRGENPWDR